MFRVLTPFYSASRRLLFLHSSSKINFYTSAEWTPKLSQSKFVIKIKVGKWDRRKKLVLKGSEGPVGEATGGTRRT